MKYYRLINKLHEQTPLGYGNAAGRWNRSGTPLIYAANKSAISFVELLSIKGPTVATTAWLLVTFQVNRKIPYLETIDLLDDWNQRPYPRSTQFFGSQWAQSQLSPFLKVPPCRLPLSSYPDEHNLLINPLHPDTAKLITNINVEEVAFNLNKWS